MDNYEINILRRGGNWKKVKPDDLVLEETNSEFKEHNQFNNEKLKNDFISYLTKVDSIITRLESLESERNKLKEELKIFEDEFFKHRIETSDFIIIDNNPKVLPRERFCEFVEKYQSDNSQVILDNCTWNLDAYNFMLGRYFCMDFPGQNKSGETTVTSLFFAKKTSKYFSPEQIKAWEKTS